MDRRTIQIGSVSIGPENQQLVLISGPCVIESEEHTLRCAERLATLCSKRGVHLIFKASYDKANRSSSDSFRGPGLHEGLRILTRVKERFGLPVTTDVHTPEEAAAAALACDLIQVPAFLCRQTDLIEACGRTQRPVNVKKGQFLSPWEMKNIVDKLEKVGNRQILLTERGTTFGYNNLVCDMRSIPILQDLGVPACFDASHAVQLPGAAGTASGGERRFIPTLAAAAVAAGVDALFIETHPEPNEAKSDRATVFPLDQLGALLDRLVALHRVVR